MNRARQEAAARRVYEDPEPIIIHTREWLKQYTETAVKDGDIRVCAMRSIEVIREFALHR